MAPACYPDHADDAEQLLRAADVALFRAKELGRNRYALYKPALYDAAAQKFRLEQSLRRAVEAGDLMLMFQPQIALHTFEVIGLEALLRWRKPDGRIATATEFIHIAEKTGLIHELTDWVLRSATSTVAAWRAQGWHRASVAINISAPQFFESDFCEHIARALEVTGLPASALELELTETVFQTGPATVDSLRRLRELGVSIALDDFGIGYSSLTSLEQLPITRVKLDRMLVEGVDSNPRSAAIVRSIVALCHGLGLQVIAEGVERPAQLEFLSHCGPIGVQGYLLAYPVETQDAEKESPSSGRACAQHPGDDGQHATEESPTRSLVFVGNRPPPADQLAHFSPEQAPATGPTAADAGPPPTSTPQCRRFQLDPTRRLQRGDPGAPTSRAGSSLRVPGETPPPGNAPKPPGRRSLTFPACRRSNPLERRLPAPRVMMIRQRYAHAPTTGPLNKCAQRESRRFGSRTNCTTNGPSGAVAQSGQRRLNLSSLPNRSHSTGPSPQFTRSLRPPHQQLTNNRQLQRIELQRPEFRITEPMLVLRHAAAESGLLHHEMLFRQRVHCLLDRGFAQLQHRIPVALLIAGIHQRIERQRILIGGRDLLFDQTANDTRFERSQLNLHAHRRTRPAP